MKFEVENINELDELTLKRKEGRVAKNCYSRIFWGLVLYSLIAGVAVFIAEAVLYFKLGPDGASAALENPYIYWPLTMLSMYLVSFPLFLLYIRRVPARVPFRDVKIGAGEFTKLFFVSVAVMQIGNVIANILVPLIRSYTGYQSTSSEGGLESMPLPLLILFAVIIAPIIEELIFRKAIIDRLGKYGEGMAVAISAIAFGLFHGNLTQMIYTTLFGFVLGNMYLKSGNIKLTILMHMLVNLFGTLPSILIANATDYLLASPDTASREYLIAIILAVAVPIFFFTCIGIGIVTLFRAKKTGLFDYYYQTESNISFLSRLRCVLLNPGAICFILLYGFSIISTLVPLG